MLRHRPGSQIVDIEKLASPLRYDVIVRRDFFNFVASERRLYDRNPERFSALSTRQAYHVWFERIFCELFRRDLLSDAAKRANAFSEKVSRCVALYDSFQAQGFLPKHPITLRTGREILNSRSGKRLSQRIFVGDGCHRLALLLLNGISHLQADWYRVSCSPRYVPRDNTLILLPYLNLSEDIYSRFISRSFDADCSTIEALISHVTSNAPDRLAELLTILGLDLRHIPSTADMLKNLAPCR